MTSRSRRGFMAGAMAMMSTLSYAQHAYPGKPIRLVVPFAPGGVADTVARWVSVELGSALAQPVIVENRTGASGTLAATYVARAEPDGYTLLLIAASHASSKALYPSVPYDPVESFTAIAGLAAYPVVLLVKPDSPYRTLRDLMDALKARPGKLNNANPGPSTVPGLAAELFRAESGLSFTSVAYKGSAPALTAVMSGEVDFAFNEMGSALSLVKSGRLRALAVMQKGRLSAFPDVPSIDEARGPHLYASAWLGMLAPRQTPALVVQRLSTAIGRIMASPGMTARIQAMGGTSLDAQPDAFATFLADETQRWTATIHKLGLKAE